MLNYDSGAIPSSLIQISETYGLEFSQQGLLGSLVYLGLSVSSLLAGIVLQFWSPKWVIALTMTANLGFCVMFVLAPSLVWLLASRFGVGASQAFLVIYSPVWVGAELLFLVNLVFMRVYLRCSQ
jgi:predicted MFS family arabinose efflux permease